MKQLIITFPVEMWYEPEQFKEVNKIMEDFGNFGRVGLGGTLGDVSIKVDDDFVFPETDFTEMVENLQKVFDDHFKDIESVKTTVKYPTVEIK